MYCMMSLGNKYTSYYTLSFVVFHLYQSSGIFAGLNLYILRIFTFCVWSPLILYCIHALYTYIYVLKKISELYKKPTHYLYAYHVKPLLIQFYSAYSHVYTSDTVYVTCSCVCSRQVLVE